ncbi:TPA: hypothetical protein ACTYDP_003299 [Klebsiella pneumoniae]
MTITLQAVNELIVSLESAGELSIREQKFLKLAKAFKQLASENVALKRVPETDSVAMLLALDSFRSEPLPDVGLQKAFESLMYHRMTPATDAYLAGIKADGVEEWVSSRGGRWNGTTEEALKFAKQLREGADKC